MVFPPNGANKKCAILLHLNEKWKLSTNFSLVAGFFKDPYLNFEHRVIVTFCEKEEK